MPSITTSLPPIAYPGLVLGHATQYDLGLGTHLYEGQIIASLSGRPIALPAAQSTGTKTNAKPRPTLTIQRQLPSPLYAPTPSAHVSNTNVLPSIGSIVLARVLRVRSRQVDIGILCVGLGTKETGSLVSASYPTNDDLHVCANEWPAVIRREDVRATEKEKVVCAEGFKVGDVVRGVVISMGDSANYYVSTAKNELGVLMARGEASGELMVPVNWKEFVDVGSGVREGRKVAKPV